VFDVVVAFPWMKVAVKTRDERVSEIRYLPSSVPAVEPKNPLAARADETMLTCRAVWPDPEDREAWSLQAFV